MKIKVGLAILGLIASSVMASAAGISHSELNAPVVPSSSSVTNAQVGALIYDQSTGNFEGLNASGTWLNFGSPWLVSSGVASYNGQVVVGGSTPSSPYSLTINGISPNGASMSMLSPTGLTSSMQITDGSNYAFYLGVEASGGGIFGSGDSNAFVLGSFDGNPIEFFTGGSKSFIIHGTGAIEATGAFSGDLGVQLNTSASQPSCDSGHRGTLWNIQGGTGVADVIQVCIKDATDTYVWKSVSLF